MPPKTKKVKEHYVDNEKFFEAMCEWKAQCKEAEDSGDDRPPVSEYIGECFVKIAEHLSTKPNFINYEYRDEMIGDGIENCLLYAHNFDPEKSSNPFAYFTQMIYYAFIRRINKEKKQMYVKYKLAEQSSECGHWNSWQDDTPLSKKFSLTESDLEKFDTKKKKNEQNTDNL